MAHPAIHSCGEPWLGLPLVKLPDPDLTLSTFGHASVARSLAHVIDLLPEGRKDYLAACGRMMETVYSKIAHGSEATYFLDKTPRYYQIIPELAEMFPDAKFVILHRELPSVYASILNYIGGQLKYLPTWKQDIVEGYPALERGRRLLGQRAFNLSYADLVKNPQYLLKQLIAFLDLPWKDGLEKDLDQSRVERGDPTGTVKYKAVSTSSLDSWRKTIDSTTKRDEAVQWLSEARKYSSDALGDGFEEQLSELANLRVGFNLKDALSLRVGNLYFNYQINAVCWGLRRRKMNQSSTLY